MNVAIVDDNEIDQILLEKLVNGHEALSLKGIYSNAIEASEGIKNSNPDMLILDVEMPEMSGIELIKAMEDVPLIILVTSHEKYALEAFENDVIDFVVKPPTKERFHKAVDKALKMHDWLSLDTEDDSYIFIRVDREDVKLVLKDILFVEAMSDYIRIQTSTNKYLVLSTMKAISSKLPTDNFIRTHRSFIVNTKKVSSFDGTDLTVETFKVPVSRNSKSTVKAALT